MMRSAAIRALLAAAVLCLAGCSSEHRVTGPLPLPGPPFTPNSPSNAILVFDWGWDHRDLDALRNVLAGDLLFVFAPGDSAGNAFPDQRINREEMLEILHHLFVGGGPVPPATSIHLVLDNGPPLPDSRPGKDPKWHKEFETSVYLTIMVGSSTEYRVTGNARFFVVRGDSAAIPADLAVGPDSTRWYIQQWNDETLNGPAGALGSLAVMPLSSSDTTWGQILALYYGAPAAARP